MDYRKTIIDFTEKQFPLYKEMSLAIHAKPEVSNYEFFASRTLSEQLKAEGFSVRVDVAGHRTGFTASYKSSKPGPVLVFLAEYDALPGLGHGCGHNLFGVTSVLAAAALKQVIDETGGEVRVYGTPGEEGGENGSAKGSFVREGFFKDVDAALCEHPGHRSCNMLSQPTIGCAPLDVEFFGKSAHAASAPWDGVNALDAMIAVFNAMNQLRQQVRPDVRMHGVILDGGSAPNIIPDHTFGKFYMRAASMPDLYALIDKFKNIVAAAALATGCRSRCEPYQNIVENLVVTPLFDEVFRKELESFGESVNLKDPTSIGSSDVGNVSQVVPTIQPYIGITDHDVPNHSALMKAAACSEKGLATIKLGAKVLSLTALDLILDPQLLQAIKEEHARKIKEQ